MVDEGIDMGFMLLESMNKAVRKTEGPDDQIDH